MAKNEQERGRTIRKYAPVLQLLAQAVTAVVVTFLVWNHFAGPVVAAGMVTLIYGILLAYWVGYQQGRDDLITEISHD